MGLNVFMSLFVEMDFLFFNYYCPFKREKTSLHDDFVAVKMCHSPNPTPLGFMHMQVYCFPVSCDIFGSRAVIRPERTPNCACVTKSMHP